MAVVRSRARASAALRSKGTTIVESLAAFRSPVVERFHCRCITCRFPSGECTPTPLQSTRNLCAHHPNIFLPPPLIFAAISSPELEVDTIAEDECESEPPQQHDEFGDASEAADFFELEEPEQEFNIDGDQHFFFESGEPEGSDEPEDPESSAEKSTEHTEISAGSDSSLLYEGSQLTLSASSILVMQYKTKHNLWEICCSF